MRKSVLLGTMLLGWSLSLPAGAATVKLSSELLTLHQLPTGWIAASASSSAIPGCAATTFPAGSTTQASTGFNFKVEKGFPLLTELLGTYSNVDKAFSTLTAGLSACTHFSGTTGNKSVSGTVTKLAFNKYGDQSAAYQENFVINGTSVSGDIVVVRRGNLVMELNEGNYTSVSTSDFQGFVASAVHDL